MADSYLNPLLINNKSQVCEQVSWWGGRGGRARARWEGKHWLLVNGDADYNNKENNRHPQRSESFSRQSGRSLTDIMYSAVTVWYLLALLWA